MGKPCERKVERIPLLPALIRNTGEVDSIIAISVFDFQGRKVIALQNIYGPTPIHVEVYSNKITGDDERDFARQVEIDIREKAKNPSFLRQIQLTTTGFTIHPGFSVKKREGYLPADEPEYVVRGLYSIRTIIPYNKRGIGLMRAVRDLSLYDGTQIDDIPMSVGSLPSDLAVRLVRGSDCEQGHIEST